MPGLCGSGGPNQADDRGEQRCAQAHSHEYASSKAQLEGQHGVRHACAAGRAEIPHLDYVTGNHATLNSADGPRAALSFNPRGVQTLARLPSGIDRTFALLLPTHRIRWLLWPLSRLVTRKVRTSADGPNVPMSATRTTQED